MELFLRPWVVHNLLSKINYTMQPLKKTTVDVVLDILNACLSRYPASGFIQSLHGQYLERGFLTRRQLEGLHAKAQKADGLEPQKLATLEAIIKKLPERQKSEKPVSTAPLYEKNTSLQVMIAAILQQVPGHKRVLELQQKNNNNMPFSTHELTELKRFYTMFVQSAAK